MKFGPKKNSHVAWVLAQLKAGRKLTAMDAIRERGFTRLSGAIFILRRGTYDGIKHKIASVCAKGHGFATYSMA